MWRPSGGRCGRTEHDEYAHALEQVVEARIADLEPPHAPESRVLPPGGTVMDLTGVLERALAVAQEQHPKTSGAVKSTSTAPAKAERAARGKEPAGRARGREE
ncbi:hypothetical protein ACGF0D_39825 [Kitasatospora sp. NPDC048298]|uniref:hypothetical protein n=1 Tax=Kitasatospora sp. NPDC048298 TaxID=3364049 RepID=UPI00372267B6